MKTISNMPSQRSDPYRDWLGITSEDRPPNHYQLLGLPELEADCAKISAAFENQFRNVRRYQVGARTDEAVQLLQRLSLAYAEISDVRRKSEYDSKRLHRSGRHDNETLHDVSVAASDTPKIVGLRPPQRPPRAESVTADREKDIVIGEVISEEPTTRDAQTIVEPEAVRQPKQAGDSVDSTGVQSVADDQLGSSVQATMAKEAGNPFALETSSGARGPAAERLEPFQISLTTSRHRDARDSNRIGGVERLQICLLASFGVFLVVPVGLLLVFVAPVALVMIAAYNFVTWLTLCVLWFVRGGWRTWAGSVFLAIARIDRVIGVALGDDKQILHNFVRVVILVIGLAAGLALLASGTAILL